MVNQPITNADAYCPEPSSISAVITPKPLVGCWVFGGVFRLHISNRPNWFHRTMMRLLLDIVWEDTK